MLLFLPLCSAWCFVLNGYGYSFIWCWVETEMCHCSTCPSWWQKSNSIDQTSLAEKQSSQISGFVRKHGVLWGRFGFKEISNNGIQPGGCLLLLFQRCLPFPWCPAICPALTVRVSRSTISLASLPSVATARPNFLRVLSTRYEQPTQETKNV